ncbi:hypothetical protein GEMRC1_003454 [Eukaryota sp. GEM-RC1]
MTTFNVLIIKRDPYTKVWFRHSSNGVVVVDAVERRIKVLVDSIQMSDFGIDNCIAFKQSGETIYVKYMDGDLKDLFGMVFPSIDLLQQFKDCVEPSAGQCINISQEFESPPPTSSQMSQPKTPDFTLSQKSNPKLSKIPSDTDLKSMIIQLLKEPDFPSYCVAVSSVLAQLSG